MRSPTTRTDNGEINLPKRTASRRKEQTKQVAMEIHGAVPSQMDAAYSGMFATLTSYATINQLTEMFSRSPTVKENIIPKKLR